MEKLNTLHILAGYAKERVYLRQKKIKGKDASSAMKAIKSVQKNLTYSPLDILISDLDGSIVGMVRIKDNGKSRTVMVDYS